MTEFGGHPSLHLHKAAWQLLTIGMWSLPPSDWWFCHLLWPTEWSRNGSVPVLSLDLFCLPSHLFPCYANMPSTAQGKKKKPGQSKVTQLFYLRPPSDAEMSTVISHLGMKEQASREQLKEGETPSQHRLGDRRHSYSCTAWGFRVTIYVVTVATGNGWVVSTRPSVLLPTGWLA